MKRGTTRPEKLPFWAERQFRWLVGILLLGLACLAVFIFEILPALEKRRAGGQALPGRHDFLTEADLAAPPPARFAAGLESVKDLTPADESDPGYISLVRRVREAEPGELVNEAKRVDYSWFEKRPADLRGRVVRVVALLGSVGGSAIPLTVEPGSVEWVYPVYLVDPSGTEGYVVHLVVSPPQIERWALVTADAVFLKLVTYEAKLGPKTAPLLIGRTMTRVAEKRPVAAWNESQLLLGAIIVAGVLVALALAVFFLGRRPERPRPLPADGTQSPLRSTGPPRFRLPSRPLIWKRPAAPRREARVFSGGVRRARSATSMEPGRRHRSMVLRILPLVLLLAGVGVLYKLAPWKPGPVEESKSEANEALNAARAAHEKVLEVERKVWERGERLEPADLALLRAQVRILIASAEKVHAHLDLLRGNGAGLESSAGELASSLLRTKAWLLDAEDVADSVKAEPGARPPGLFIPLNLAIGRLRAAEKDLSDLESGGAQARERLEALRSAIEGCRRDLLGLADYLRKGLVREDLTAVHLPELAAIESEAARAQDLARRVEEKLAESAR